MGGRNVLIVTDKGVRNAGLLDGIAESVSKEGLQYAVFDRVEPNPTVEVMEDGFSALEDCKGDCIVGVGGGSAIDTAKAIGALSANPKPIQQYEGPDKLPNPILPLIAVPTTTGTGSEVTGASVVTDTSRKYKISVRSPYLVPKIAVLDPSLVCTLPQRVIAETGMDALVHAIESFISLGASPITEGLALEAMKLIGDNLRAFYSNPGNMDAAGKMLTASTMAAMSFANARLGCVHAMAHTLGGHYNIAHGVACAVLLPHAMDHSLIAVPEKYIRIAEALGEKTQGLPLMDGAANAIEAVVKLSVDIGIPENLEQLGVKEDGIEQMSKDAVQSGIHMTTPRRIDLEGIEAMFRNAL